jgi:hypothetical protein
MIARTLRGGWAIVRENKRPINEVSNKKNL